MVRPRNFSAGPAQMPEDVLRSAQAEFMDFAGTGMSVLEMSHRSAAYRRVIDAAEASLRDVLGIPDSYGVLFLQGGATLEFAGIPMNLMRRGRAGHIVSGHFAKVAAEEAAKYGSAEILATSEPTGFDRIPDLPAPEAFAGMDYGYICQNNTIYGTMFHELPDCGGTPLVADVSSCFLSFPLDVTDYGLLFAGAQKNAGPSGVCVLVVDRSLVEEGPALGVCPTYLDLSAQLARGSMLNTPNTFGIYLCGKVFDWVRGTGGLEAMGERNAEKAALLYGAIDRSDLYLGCAVPSSRSVANVTFRLPTPELEREFVERAAGEGLVGLAGHRLVGGIRASIYNAVDIEAVRDLVAFMESFELSVTGRSF